MDITVKKSQFKLIGTALAVLGHIKLTDDNGVSQPYRQDTIEYTTSNDQVATIAADPTDPEKFQVNFAGDGNTLLMSKARTDEDGETEPKFVTASINLTVVEDEDTKMEMVLDL